MDKKKRIQAQQASIRSSGSRPPAKAAQGRQRYAPAKTVKPDKRSAVKPSKPMNDTFEEEDMLNARAETVESREATAAALANPASSFFGGIDGIISMMGKANQMIKLFQQMGPLFKLLGMFGGGGKAATASVRLNRRRRAHSRGGNKSRR